MNTTGNTILITGGTSGIGLAFAKEFMKRGNRVIICGRRQERLVELEKSIPGIQTICSDVSKESDRIELAKTVINNFPDVNILMNNAGVQLTFDLKQEAATNRILSEVNTNFVAPIHLSSLFIKHFSTRTSAIINISSGLAFVPIAFMPVYCATKAAIHSYTDSLRYQLRDTSTQVFEVAPPAVDTELGHDRRKDPNESHGGMPVDAFLQEAMKALEDDILEAPIADAKHLKEQGMKMFDALNVRFNH